jgi:hypothetical protein
VILMCAAALAVASVFVTASGAALRRSRQKALAINPADFGTKIDNQFLPLKPGTIFIYTSGKGGRAERDEVYVTHDTKQILGVACTVVRDRAWSDGDLTEDTLDWYAQDKAGNVWCLGEDSKSYKNGVVVSAEGSWEAGVKGAHAGIVMEAHPRVGDSYRQESAPGAAEDTADVVSLSKSARVPYGSYDRLLMTKEWSPLESGTAEYRFYARGIGFILAVSSKGGSQRCALSQIRTESRAR